MAIRRANTTVLAWSPRMALVSGAVKEIGRNTRTVVRVEAMTGERTWFTARITTSCSGPFSIPARSDFRTLWMFSITTIEESITIPTARAIPPREIRLRLTPKKYIRTKDNTRVTGREMPMSRVLRSSPRVRNTMSMASAAPMRAERATLLIERSMNSAGSRYRGKTVSSGSSPSARASSSTRCTSRDIVRTLPPSIGEAVIRMPLAPSMTKARPGSP